MEKDFKDLKDPVYEYLKDFVKDGWKLLGGKITERKGVGPATPRKVIELLVESPQGIEGTFTYNYKKIERKLDVY